MNTLNIDKHSASISMEIAFFSDGDYRIAYSPALDLSGQGKTDHEAIQSLLQVVKITLAWARENNTLHKMLLDHGWVLQEHPILQYKPPAFNAAKIKKDFSIRQFETKKVPVPVYA